MARRGKVIPFPKSPPDVRQAQGPGGGWIDVHRCRDQAEALVVRSLFESGEIPCILRSRLAHSVHPFTVGDQGEVVILVQAADAPRARILLARIAARPTFP